MSRGVNKAIIVGHLGQDPEVRYTGSGSAIVKLNVATKETWKDKQSGETQERTEWHRIVIFGKLGEIAGQYLRKGSLAYFEGRIQTRKWQDQSGADRYSTEIVAGEMQMLGGGARTSDQPQQHEAPLDRPDPATAPRVEKPADAGPGAGGPQDDGFDDIPF